MKHTRYFSIILLLAFFGLSSCQNDAWQTDYMRTGAIFKFTTRGVPTTNYEIKFYEGKINNVHSDVAMGKKEPANKHFRTRKGNDGKAQNIWLPVGTFTVIVVNHDTKSFVFTTFEAKFDSYAKLTADFDNTTDCGCGNLYRESWDIPVTYTN